MARTEDGGRGIRWRHWNRSLHRDVGYFVVGLTVIYAISGIAVNHIDSWNPSYTFERVEESFEPFEPTDREETVATLLERLDLPEPIDSFRRTPAEVALFYDGWSVEADVLEGTALVERPRERPVLYQFNVLHLNHAKGAWTWIADAYAVLLVFMPISGLFILRGKKGFGGRGKWLVTAGVLLPVLFLWWSGRG